jgi:gliding motility-associated-like protein
VKDVALLNSKAGTTVTLSITVSDGLNTSTPTQVAVIIKPVNKAPAFDVVADKEVCITTTTQTFFVTGATATEATQTFGFTISADQSIFDALTIDAAGVVSYKLKATATGKANITIGIKDNGGTVNGGVDVFQHTFAINVNSLPVISISSNKGTNVSKGDVVQLTASGAATYNWGSGTDAVFTVRPQANTTYNVTGTNTAGCPGTAQITITIIEDYKVDATNILTPNGDGINDRWVIRNIDSYPDNELKIFDRTGRIVYQRRNYSNDWDGTMNGRRLAEGTYYYILTIDGSGKTVKGYITIIADQK